MSASILTRTTIIGLEVHVQLQTQSKLFCGCANKFNPDNPNTQTCPVCMGLPGSLPVLNREAFRLAVKTGLALNCEIAEFTKWDRKQYYYPDLPKAYQISQYDLPFSSEGYLEIVMNSANETEQPETRRIGLFRAHLEEDAGKNLHDESGRGGESRVDLNRCGTPLVEIVSKPDLRSAEEARQFLEEIRLLLTYIGVSDCNMQEGSLRCDANVNLHIETEDGQKIATPIVEVKNLNSFRGVEAAIEFEVTRQTELWQKTGQTIGDVAKQTRGWNADRNVTFPQRGKEDEADYRYFPDPDLVPITVDQDWLGAVREELCEFPAQRRQRFQSEFALSDYDAAVIIDQGPNVADYFEAVAKNCGNGKLAANWVTQDVLRELNNREISISDFPVSPEILAELLKKITAEELTKKSARDALGSLLKKADSGTDITVDLLAKIIEDEDLAIVSDQGALSEIIAKVLENNAGNVDDVKSGKLAAVGPLIGQVMREIKGADPKTVRDLLIKSIQE